MLAQGSWLVHTSEVPFERPSARPVAKEDDMEAEHGLRK